MRTLLCACASLMLVGCSSAGTNNPASPTMPSTTPVVSVPITPPPGSTPPALTVSVLAVTGTTKLPVQMSSQTPNGLPIASYAWLFGDEPAGAAPVVYGATVPHIYQQAGLFTVTLKVTDGLGRTAMATTTASITDPPPPPQPPPVVPGLSLAITCSHAGLTVSCNVSAIDETGMVQTANLDGHVSWDMGDGTSPATAGALKIYTYSQTGTFTIAVSATIGTRSGSNRTIVTVN